MAPQARTATTRLAVKAPAPQSPSLLLRRNRQMTRAGIISRGRIPAPISTDRTALVIVTRRLPRGNSPMRQRIRLLRASFKRVLSVGRGPSRTGGVSNAARSHRTQLRAAATRQARPAQSPGRDRRRRNHAGAVPSGASCAFAQLSPDEDSRHVAARAAINRHHLLPGELRRLRPPRRQRRRRREAYALSHNGCPDSRYPLLLAATAVSVAAFLLSYAGEQFRGGAGEER